MKSSFNYRVLLFVLLQLFSLAIATYLLVTIFAVYTGLIPLRSILLALVLVFFAVVFRYAALFHDFTNNTSRTIIAVTAAVGVVGSTVIALYELYSELSLIELTVIFVDMQPTFLVDGTIVLPDWWAATFLVIAGILILVGVLLARDHSPYPKPTELSTIVRSPVYFGVFCGLLGLWSVLFVGISLQRVIIFAPIFEELLKFGVALIIGSVLFGRSMAARIGVALVIGSLFGVIEHATTYPDEPDAVYLLRTLFHSITTVLSVAVYTKFESIGELRLRWVAPMFPILLHFFYNTFVTVTAIITIAAFDSQSTILALTYGTGVILIATLLSVLFIASKTIAVVVHRPFESLLDNFI